MDKIFWVLVLGTAGVLLLRIGNEIQENTVWEGGCEEGDEVLEQCLDNLEYF